MKRNDLIVFEITENSLRVLRARRGSGEALQVLGFDAVPVAQPSREDLARILASMVKAKDKKAQVVVILARGQVIFKDFSLPAQNKEELQKMIALQMAAQVPYAREDIVFDHTVLGQDAQGYTRVLSAVVHKDVAEEYFKLFRSAGLTVHQFVLSSSSIVRWIFASGAAGEADKAGTLAVLNIEGTRSEFCFARAGELVYAREIKYGRRDIGADLEHLFVKEATLTLTSYEREHPSEPVEDLYVLAPSSAHGRLREILPALKGSGGHLTDPLEVVRKDKNIALEALDPGGDLSPVVCLGAAHESLRPAFDLLPKEVQKTQKAQAQKGQWVRFFVFFAINAGLLLSFLLHNFYKEQMYLGTLKASASSMRARAQEIKRKTEQLKEIERLSSSSGSMVDLIHGLYAMTPKEISFQLLSVDREQRLTIQGIAETRTSVNDLHRNLINSPMFKDASLQYAAQRRFFEGEITDFKITATISRLKGL